MNFLVYFVEKYLTTPKNMGMSFSRNIMIVNWKLWNFDSLWKTCLLQNFTKNYGYEEATWNYE